MVTVDWVGRRTSSPLSAAGERSATELTAALGVLMLIALRQAGPTGRARPVRLFVFGFGVRGGWERES